MTMLNANDPAFRELYPHYARVYDATGRELHNVLACDAVTGEVVMYDFRPDPRRSHAGGLLPTRRGFWPAPLRIEAKRSFEDLFFNGKGDGESDHAAGIAELDALFDGPEVQS